MANYTFLFSYSLSYTHLICRSLRLLKCTEIFHMFKYHIIHIYCIESIVNKEIFLQYYNDYKLIAPLEDLTRTDFCGFKFSIHVLQYAVKVKNFLLRTLFKRF